MIFFSLKALFGKKVKPCTRVKYFSKSVYLNGKAIILDKCPKCHHYHINP